MLGCIILNITVKKCNCTHPSRTSNFINILFTLKCKIKMHMHTHMSKSHTFTYICLCTQYTRYFTKLPSSMK